jgi:hypothetical protein
VYYVQPQNELKAPPGKFRAIGVDTFEASNADYLIGDYSTVEEAIRNAADKAGAMNPCYVYDDKGDLRWHGGSF